MSRKFVTAIVLVGAALASAIPYARADPLDCAAVDTLAQLYVPRGSLFSINIIGDSDRKVCYFSIDGATSDTAASARPSIQRGIEYLAQMKKMSLAGVAVAQFKSTTEEFIDYLPYLLSSAHLDEGGQPPEFVKQVVAKNATQFSDCFARFYGHSSVKISGDNFHCENLAKPENALLVGINGRTSYDFYTFR